MAKEMIRVAKSINPSGLVKFQLHEPEDKGWTPWTRDHALTFEQAKELFDFGASIGQEVFFSVFAPKYVGWCERIGVKRYKIAAGMIENYNLQAPILLSGKPCLISMADYGYITESRLIRFLYCPPGYPQSGFAMPMFHHGFYVGFSDHTIGLNAAFIALARGAQIVEKHFVLEHNKDFPDNDWSMTPDGLRELVRWEAVCREVVG